MRHNYSKELLEQVIKESKTWAEVCRKIGVKPFTGNQTYVKKRSIDFSIDFSHFVGQAFNKGKIATNRREALSHCFKGSIINSHRLKEKLLRDSIKEAKCEICNISEWMGESIVLELDHKDNDHFNNELINLQILCPNCHALETRRRLKGGMAKLGSRSSLRNCRVTS